MPVNESLTQLQTIVQPYGEVRESLTQAQAILKQRGQVRESLTQMQVLAYNAGATRVSLVQAQVLVPVVEQFMPLTYPQLIGLGYSVKRRHIGATSIGTAAGGGEVRIGFFQYPLYEFDLTYEVLADTQTENSTTASDIRTMIGFYDSCYQNLLAFQFLCPEDNAVTAQTIGTGDGSTTVFTLQRVFGASGYGVLAPIGMLNTSKPLNVYVNGTLKTLTTDYTVNTSVPNNNFITFTSAPAESAVVSVDMQYYYWMRFLEPNIDWEEFLYQRWRTDKITLRSLRNN